MNQVLSEGLAMMLIGMGTVLMFLCIMIVAMNVMSWAVAKINEIFPAPVTVTGGGKKAVKASDDSEIAAAIVAALFKKWLNNKRSELMENWKWKMKNYLICFAHKFKNKQVLQYAIFITIFHFQFSIFNYWINLKYTHKMENKDDKIN